MPIGGHGRGDEDRGRGSRAPGRSCADRYTCGMAEKTTMKITTDTRDRLRALGAEGDSLEDVVVTALNAYESQQFWAVAEAAADTETPEERAERKRVEAEVDGWMDDLR